MCDDEVVIMIPLPNYKFRFGYIVFSGTYCLVYIFCFSDTGLRRCQLVPPQHPRVPVGRGRWSSGERGTD